MYARAEALPKFSNPGVVLGVSRSTIYKYVPELKPGSDLQAGLPASQRSAPAGRITAQEDTPQ